MFSLLWNFDDAGSKSNRSNGQIDISQFVAPTCHFVAFVGKISFIEQDLCELIQEDLACISLRLSDRGNYDVERPPQRW